MPRLANVNLVGVLVAGIVIWLLGFLWYGILFAGPWMSGHQWTEDMYAGNSPMWMVAGFVIPLVLAFGLGWHMKQTGVATLKTAVLSGLWLALLIGVPLMAYNFVYSPTHSFVVFLIDGSHTLVSFVLGSAVLSYFD